MIFGQFDNHVTETLREWHEKNFATIMIFCLYNLYNYLFLQCSVFLRGCLSILFELTYLYFMVVFSKHNFDPKITQHLSLAIHLVFLIENI